MAVGALGRRHFLYGTMGFKSQLLERGLVVRVPQTQTAVASLSTGPHGAIARDHKGAVLACLNLEKEIRGHTLGTVVEIT